jgi:signal peptidase I
LILLDFHFHQLLDLLIEQGVQVEKSWKPKGWLSIFFGICFQQFAFLYVNKAKLFWLYLLLMFAVVTIEIKLHAVIKDDSWYQSLYFSWLFSIICPLHAYIISRQYDQTQRRHWYASWWGTLGCFMLVFASIFSVRTFMFEPFSIPARSMSPTFNPGDQLIVSKQGFGNYRYLGMTIQKSEPTVKLNRGDVVVFQSPLSPQVEYIKRVIGLPGDTIIYRDKTIFIKPACIDNAESCAPLTALKKEYKFSKEDAGVVHEYYQESVADVSYEIKLRSAQLDLTTNYYAQAKHPLGEWVVPAKHYFVMGDNRDNSLDSRFWGFVPEGNLIGTPVFVW